MGEGKEALPDRIGVIAGGGVIDNPGPEDWRLLIPVSPPPEVDEALDVFGPEHRREFTRAEIGSKDTLDLNRREGDRDRSRGYQDVRLRPSASTMRTMRTASDSG